MTVRLTNEISETTRTIYCSACGNQEQAKRHVDFDAACDRGYGKDEAVQVSYDDLILCEDCIRPAARLLGMEDTETSRKIQRDLERKLEIESKAREKAEAYADRLEEAFDSRPAQIKLDHRKKPRERQVA